MEELERVEVASIELPGDPPDGALSTIFAYLSGSSTGIGFFERKSPSVEETLSLAGVAVLEEKSAEM